MSVDPQEVVVRSEASNEASIETTVVHSLGCIVGYVHKPYPIYKLNVLKMLK